MTVSPTPRVDVIEQAAQVIDALHDDYAPRYNQAGECVGSTTADALQAAGLLATAQPTEAAVRVKPTAEQIAAVFTGSHFIEHAPGEHVGEHVAVSAPAARYFASQVLALLADQPTAADVAADMLDQAAATDDPEFHIEVALGGSNYVRDWLHARAALIRGGER